MAFRLGGASPFRLPVLCYPDRGPAVHQTPRAASGNVLELELALDQERDDDREQRDALDERREDDRARLNATGHLGLTRHAVHSLSGETSDTDARADYGETRANAGAEHAPRTRVLLGERGCSLKQRKDRDHFRTPFNNRDMSCSRSLDRHPSTRLSPQRDSPARSAGYLHGVEHSPRQCAPSRISPMKTVDRSVKMNACRNAMNNSSSEMAIAMAIGSGTRIQVANVKMRLISASSTTWPEIMLAKRRIARANGLV